MMIFSLEDTIDVLSRTPRVLRELLEDLDPKWVNFRKHGQAFSPKDVIGHLILGEKNDWILRLKIILSTEEVKNFPPFERRGFDRDIGLKKCLDQFERFRIQNLVILKTEVTINDLKKTGIHPEFGEVTLEQHLATWVVHDLTHLFQITEALALRYKETVGPWIEYLRILQL
jgi:hypothetical protein